MIQYIAPIFAFLAAFVGVLGNTWNEKQAGFLKITWIGYVAISIALVCLVISLVQVHKNRVKIEQQTAHRKQVRQIAYNELRRTVQRLMGPFTTLCENAILKFDDLGGGMGTLSNYNKLFIKLREQKFIGKLRFFDLREYPKYPDVYPQRMWWEWFSESAIEAAKQFDDVIGKYSPYLDSDLLSLIEDIRMDELFMLLRNLSTLVAANEHLPHYYISYAFHPNDHNKDYTRFLDKVENLNTYLEK